MPPTSQIGAAQDGLKALIDARKTAGQPLEKVEVDLGYPPGGPQTEHVWIPAEIENWTQVWQTTGATASRDEFFRLKVYVVATKSTERYTEARDRALVLAGEVEKAVRADPTLGGKVVESQIAGGEMGEGLGERERKVMLTLFVDCMALVTSS